MTPSPVHAYSCGIGQKTGPKPSIRHSTIIGYFEQSRLIFPTSSAPWKDGKVGKTGDQEAWPSQPDSLAPCYERPAGPSLAPCDSPCAGTFCSHSVQCSCGRARIVSGSVGTKSPS